MEYFIGPKYFTRLYFMAGIFGAALWLAFNFHSYIIAGQFVYRPLGVRGGARLRDCLRHAVPGPRE